ncbi:oligoendopeptidase F [Brevibacillus dissolubilis]|uniref:oligoendopeptidase F n=1 Tax=Brevibacillus dissolubilis TaxID=1844116 RepID=UPI00111676AC|nr:oligoendopeptidase F [Brevibacillus dissolubilis]
MKKRLFSTMTALAVTLSMVSTPFIPYSNQAVVAADAVTKPTYKNRTEIPDQYKWKLEHIYATKAAWEADVKKVEDLANAFTKHQGKLQTAAALKKALDDYSNLFRLHDKAYVYAIMSFDVNSGNPDLQALSDRAEKMTVLVSSKTSWLSPEITKIPDQKMAAFLKSASLAPYKYYLNNVLRTKAHTLSPELESTLASIKPLADAPESTWKMLYKDIKFPTVKDENGKDIQITRANFVSLLDNKNPEVRKAVFQAFYGTMAQYQDTFAQTIGAEVKGNNLLAKTRKYNSALEAALTPNDVPVEVYDQLITSVNKGLPQLHRYMELKKRVLNMKELHMYDIYIPMTEGNDSYIPYEQAQQMVLDGLQPLGEEYVNVLKEAFKGGWVDVYSTDDKRTGAYQWGAYDTHPYVLLNYQGTNDDVFTIAHELGHAMQSYYTNKKQPYISSNYPIFTAEIASTLNEHLLFKSMYKNAKTKAEKMYLLNQYLENFRTTLFRQTQFAEFEKAIHDREQKGESLNAAAVKQIYLDINKKYYGPAVVSDEEIAMEWSRVQHFYYGYYVYQYSTSFAASAALAKQVLDEGKPAVDRIRTNFLEAGNSDSPIAIMKRAGVDMSTSAPIDQTIELFEETLNELETLLNEK